MKKKYLLSDLKTCEVCGCSIEVFSSDDDSERRCTNCGRRVCDGCKATASGRCKDCPEQTSCGTMSVAKRGYLFGNLTGNPAIDPPNPRVARRWYQAKATPKGLRNNSRVPKN
jgi:hypothetical protein